MNSSQNEIVEKLIGGDVDHGFGSFKKTEIYNLTNISPTSTVLGLINKFCKVESAKDIEYINKRIGDWKGPNLHWQNKIRKILNKIRHAYRDQLPPNIITSEDTIKWEKTTEQAPSDKSLEEQAPNDKPVDDIHLPSESSETDEKGEKREKNMEELAKKPITEEEEKKIEEFQAKHDINLKDKAFTELSNANQLQ